MSARRRPGAGPTPEPTGGPRRTAAARPGAARLRHARRLLDRYRRPVAAVLAGVAALAAMAAVRPSDPVTVPVVVAAGDLPAGTALAADDLRVVSVPEPYVPGGAVADPTTVVDRVLATPALAGEPLTATRLVGGPDGRSTDREVGPGRVAAPVRIADPGSVALLAPGDVVDVLAADETTVQAAVVARAARVLAVPRSRGAASGGGLLAGDGGSSGLGPSGDGSLVVLDVTPATALDLAQAAATRRLSVVLHPGR